MNRPLHPLLALALLAGIAATPAWAASSASSASSEGSSASVGSSSTSFEKSSESSSPGDKKAEGPYRIVHVAAADAGKVRVALKAVNGDHQLVLLLPQETAQQAGLAAGGIITAKVRDYGVQFALADKAEPFFLVLDDARFDEMKTRPVKI